MTRDIPMNAINGNKQSNIVVEDEKNAHYQHTLEEAMEATKIGKCQTILICLTGLSIMGASLENVNLSYVLPYAKCDLNLSIREQGLLSSVSFLGIVSTSYFWGFLADTWGRKKVLCVAALCGFGFSFASGFATNISILIFLRFMAGASLAGSQAGAFSYISEFHTVKTAPRAVAFASSFYSGLYIFVALIAMTVIPLDFTWTIFSLNFKPWRLSLICNSFINLWNGVVFAFLPESPKFLLAIGEREKALQVLRRIYAFNTGLPEETYPIKEIQPQSNGGSSLASIKGFANVVRLLWAQTKPIFLHPLRKYTWKLCYLIFAIFAIGHGCFVWFTDFLMQLQSYDGLPKVLCDVVQPKNISACSTLDNKNVQTYQILLAVGLFFFISGTLSSFMMKKVSPKIIICTWLLISSLTCFALNFLKEFNATVLSFVIFLSCCSCANIVMAVAVNLFPTNYRGMATAFILMCGRLGGFSGSNLIGVLLAGMCTAIFYVNGSLLLSCVLLFLTIKTGDRRPNEPSDQPK